MAGLSGAFFDTSILIAGSIDLGPGSQHALLLMDAVADGRIETSGEEAVTRAAARSYSFLGSHEPGS